MVNIIKKVVIIKRLSLGLRYNKEIKMALADHVLNTEIDRIEPCYVDIFEIEVEE